MTFVHVSLVPVMGPVGEQKTKPTQHTVKELMGLGITPDILVCRSSAPLNPETRAKLAAFCHVPEEAVISTYDVPNIYHVPLMLEAQGLCALWTEGATERVPRRLAQDGLHLMRSKRTATPPWWASTTTDGRLSVGHQGASARGHGR